jgi:drug/metabolite transporter (DMT)-like permease
VTAILGGLGAALCWTVAMLASSRASRSIGAGPTLAWVMSIGLVIVVPFVIAAGSPPTGTTVGWLAFAGIGNVAGLLCEYTAVRTGKVGMVAAIASTEGAVGAILSALTGEPISAAVGTVLAVIALGIVLAALEEDEAPVDRPTVSAVVPAVGAALCFGTSLFAIGHVSGDVDFAWVMLPARLAGVLAIAVPLALRGRLRVSREAAPALMAAATAEVVGIAVFAWGAREAIAIAAVLAGQFAAFSAVGAFFIFHERLRRIQVAGVAVIVVGVGVLALLRA